jgi:hypothetical protein
VLSDKRNTTLLSFDNASLISLYIYNSAEKLSEQAEPAPRINPPFPVVTPVTAATREAAVVPAALRVTPDTAFPPPIITWNVPVEVKDGAALIVTGYIATTQN